MFVDDIRHAAARQRTARAVRRLTLDAQRLMSEKGELGGMALARELIGRLPKERPKEGTSHEFA